MAKCSCCTPRLGRLNAGFVTCFPPSRRHVRRSGSAVASRSLPNLVPTVRRLISGSNTANAECSAAELSFVAKVPRRSKVDALIHRARRTPLRATPAGVMQHHRPCAAIARFNVGQRVIGNTGDHSRRRSVLQKRESARILTLLAFLVKRTVVAGCQSASHAASVLGGPFARPSLFCILRSSAA